MGALPLLLLAALAVPAPAQESGPEEYDARLTRFIGGDVTVVFADSAAGRKEAGVVLTQDQLPVPLAVGDKVLTGRGASAELALEADSLFELGPDSQFIIGPLRRGDSSFSLLAGRFVAKLRSMLQTGGKLAVRTPTAVASVRGTEFAMDIPRGKALTTVGVFDEGRVSVGPPEGTHAFPEETLAPRQETSVVGGASGLKIVPLGPMMGGLRASVLPRLAGRIKELRGTWKPFHPEDRRELRGNLLDLQREKSEPPGPPPRGRGNRGRGGTRRGRSRR